jgi:hypothetical protein
VGLGVGVGGGQGQKGGGGRRKRLDHELGPYLVCKTQKSIKLGRDKVTICRISDGVVTNLQESEHVLVFGRRPVPSYSPMVSPQTPGMKPGLFYFEVTVFLGDDDDQENGGDVYVGFADRGICGVPGLEDPRSIAVRHQNPKP